MKDLFGEEINDWDESIKEMIAHPRENDYYLDKEGVYHYYNNGNWTTFKSEARLPILGIFPDQKLTSDEIVNQVINKMITRSNFGVKKYGETIFRNVDENYINHLFEELLDGANYCQQILRLGEFTKTIIQLLEYSPDDNELGKRIREEYTKLMKNG